VIKSLSDYDAVFASLRGMSRPRTVDPKTGKLKAGRRTLPGEGATPIQRHRWRKRRDKAAPERSEFANRTTRAFAAMRILAISDIHNNVACVLKLRAQERNRFDVIAIPGDIGSHRASEIFEVLKSFKCPIVYIYGNWDHGLTRGASFGGECHNVDTDIVRIGSLNFTGFSFPAPGSGLTDAKHSRLCQEAILQQAAAINLDFSRTVLLAHDRARHLSSHFPSLLLHLYGHIHRFDTFSRGATAYVNTSALDRIRPFIPKSLTLKTASVSDVRHANAGNYAVIEIGSGGEIAVECMLLERC
jgi:predicted phosphodiesterase